MRGSLSDRSEIPSYQVTTQVFDEFTDLVSQSLIVQFSRVALKIGRAPISASVSVTIADDEVVRDLNTRHRGLDEYTDVLSFSYTHHGHFYGDTSSPSDRDFGVEFVAPGAEGSLGEVIVSYPQAERQAREVGHSINRELLILITHGILHLLGQDHEESKDRTEMEQLEREAIKLAGPMRTTS